MTNCKKCLLSETKEKEFFKTVVEYVENLSPEIRTPQDVYEKRLNICKACDNLINGMCRLCGCFVEIRSAKKNNYCAKSKDIW